MSFAMSFKGFESEACGIRSYEWAVGTEAGFSDVVPFSSIGLAQLNESHAVAQANLEVSVRHFYDSALLEFMWLYLWLRFKKTVDISSP